MGECEEKSAEAMALRWRWLCGGDRFGSAMAIALVTSMLYCYLLQEEYWRCGVWLSD